MKNNCTKKVLISLLWLGISLTGIAQNQKYCSFDDFNDYIKYTDDATLGRMDGATDYTIEAWIYPLAASDNYDRVLQRYYSFSIQVNEDNNGTVKDWSFVAIDNSGINHAFSTEGNATLTLNTWNHIAVICNSTTGTLKLFVNGTDVTQSGGYSNYTLRSNHSNDNLYIGQKGNGNSYFSGYIDEVRLKNVAENPANLHYHTYDNQYASDTNTAGLFHFNEGSGNSTVNEASNSNASLNNNPGWINWDTHEILPFSKYTWNGTSSDWSSTSNWNMNAIPTSKSFVEIPSGTSNDPIIGSSTNASAGNLDLPSNTTLTLIAGATLDIYGTFTNSGIYVDNGSVSFKGSSMQTIPSAVYNNMKIDNVNGLTLGGAITIKGTLTLASGIITSTSSKLLTFASTANAVSGGNNTTYVEGPMTKVGSSDFIFPCGNGGKYAQIGIANLSGSETFTAEYIKGTPASNTSMTNPLTKVSDNESWNLERAGTITADVTIYWEDSQWSGIGNFNNLRIAHWNSSLIKWEAVSGSYTHNGSVDLTSSQSGSITVTGVSSFSPFTFGTVDNITNPLPIELIDFTVTYKINNITINWTTASETNNRGFEIQRSENCLNWESLGFVLGAGNSNEALNYSFTDNKPKAQNYYRLKQIDFNKEYHLSKILFIRLKPENNIYVYPNPANDQLHISGIKLDQGTDIYIYDLMGKMIFTNNNSSQNINIAKLPKGIYYLKLDYINDESKMIKFIKK